MTETQQIKKKPNIPFLVSIFGGIGIVVATIIVYIICIPLILERIEVLPDDYYYYFEYVFLSAFAYTAQFIIAVLACIMFLLVLKMYSVGSKPGKAWLFLLAGAISWSIAEFMYMWAYLTEQNEDFEAPTPMSWFYFVGYGFFTIGLLLQAKLLPSILKKTEKIIIVGVVLTILIIWLAFVVQPVMVSYGDAELNDWDIVALIVYLAGDLAYVGLSLYLVFEFKGGSFSKSWLILVAGFLTMAAFDIFNALYYYAFGEWWVYWLDFLYMAFYVIVAIGAAHLLKTSD